MKSKLTDEIKDLLTQSVRWGRLEIEYMKLTVAEKLIMFMSAMIIGAIFMILLLPVILMLMFALSQVFMDMMPRAVAYVCVAGIALFFFGILYIFRYALVINPISRFISKLLLESKNKNTDKK